MSKVEIIKLFSSRQFPGIGPRLAERIYVAYGAQSQEIVTNNPYQLIEDIEGIGFITADRLALKRGFQKDGLLRLKAAILFALDQSREQGHLFLYQAELTNSLGNLLEPSKPIQTSKALAELVAEGKVVLGQSAQGNCVYLKRLYQIEQGAARLLYRLWAADSALPLFKLTTSPKLKKGLKPTPEQLQILKSVQANRITLLTGGPGTGKTTSVKFLIDRLEQQDIEYCLCAPTGRAAKRLAEAAQRSAQTIHRLLQLQPGRFPLYHSKKPLPSQLVIVDEVSMLDLELAYFLLQALSPTAHLFLLGDADQLPAIGPGSFFKDLIEFRRLPVIHLTKIHRQAQDSLIVVNAHRINHGRFPLFKNPEEEADFSFIEKSEPEDVLQEILKLAQQLCTSEQRLNLLDVQVLTPLYKGLVGATNLNKRLQDLINPISTKTKKNPALIWREGDKVMQIRNNYEKQVFNGERGIIEQISYLSPLKEVLTVNFDGRRVVYAPSETLDLTLAYAITIHKSQGSEFDVVILPVITSHYIMLQRNLLYTAITRARKKLYLIGSKKALFIAIKKVMALERNSNLLAALNTLAEAQTSKSV